MSITERERSIVTSRREAFRELLESGRPLTCVSGGLASHAKFAQAIGGIDAFIVSPVSSARCLLGLHDVGQLTQTELITNAGRVCATTTMPVLVDCGSGFGNPINVRRTASLVIQTGASGLIISDEPEPGRTVSDDDSGCIPAGESVSKCRAAGDARNETEPAFVVIARCCARRDEGSSLEDVVNRLVAYQNAGADVLIADGLRSLDELETVRNAVKGPLGGTFAQGMPPPRFKELEGAGVALAMLDVTLVSAGAVWDVLSNLTGKGYEHAEVLAVAQDDIHAMGKFNHSGLLGFSQVQEWEEKYLSAEQFDAKYKQSSGVYDPSADSRKGSGQ